MTEVSATVPLGVVIRKQPGVTRWARWIWRPVAVLPGAGPSDWRELRREGEAVEYHAATVPLTLHRSETEAYLIALSSEKPSVYVVLRPAEAPVNGFEWEVFTVTASAYDAQQYLDSGEEIVEPVPMPPSLLGWVWDFVERHHHDTAFVKRRRGPREQAQSGEGRGDPRVRQLTDVYLSPGSKRKEGLH